MTTLRDIGASEVPVEDRENWLYGLGNSGADVDVVEKLFPVRPPLAGPVRRVGHNGRAQLGQEKGRVLPEREQPGQRRHPTLAAPHEHFEAAQDLVVGAIGERPPGGAYVREEGAEEGGVQVVVGGVGDRRFVVARLPPRHPHHMNRVLRKLAVPAA